MRSIFPSSSLGFCAVLFGSLAEPPSPTPDVEELVLRAEADPASVVVGERLRDRHHVRGACRIGHVRIARRDLVATNDGRARGVGEVHVQEPACVEVRSERQAEQPLLVARGQPRHLKERRGGDRVRLQAKDSYLPGVLLNDEEPFLVSWR